MVNCEQSRSQFGIGLPFSACCLLCALRLALCIKGHKETISFFIVFTLCLVPCTLSRSFKKATVTCWVSIISSARKVTRKHFLSPHCFLMSNLIDHGMLQLKTSSAGLSWKPFSACTVSIEIVGGAEDNHLIISLYEL